MSTDHMILGGACVVFLLALAYAVRNRNAAAAGMRAVVRSVGETLKPVEAAVEPSAAQLLVKLHDTLDAEGKMTAALRTVGRLANSLADQHEARMGTVVAPKAAAPDAPPAS